LAAYLHSGRVCNH